MIRNRLLATALLIVPTALAGSSMAAATGDTTMRSQSPSLSRCIDTTLQPNWIAYDDHTILVQVGPRSSFKVTTDRCPQLAGPPPRINTVVRGGTAICGPRDVHLYVSDGADRATVPCIVQTIEPISPDLAREMRSRHH